MLPDPLVEVLVEPPMDLRRHLEGHACVMHTAVTDGNPSSFTRRRMDPHSEGQTTWNYTLRRG
jgi:hypothetical protein